MICLEPTSWSSFLPFDQDEVVEIIEEEVKRDPEFHVSRQVTRQRNLGLEIPQVQALLASARCVSLGTSCSVAAALQALDLRGEAGPFDWLRISARSVGYLLRTGFRDFFDIEYTQSRPGERIASAKHWQGSFWHHDVTDINVRLAFDRRIERFLRIPAGRDMIFLRAMNHLEELDEIMDLFLILKLHFQKARRVRLAVLIDLQEAEGAFSTRELGPDVIFLPVSKAAPYPNGLAASWPFWELCPGSALAPGGPWRALAGPSDQSEQIRPPVYTEYPSLYGGPCNVNRDASVKPTDAVIFLYAHADSKHFRRALDAAASAWKYCCSPCFPQQDPFDFRCEMCHVSTRTAADFAAHEAGKMHRKRVALEQCWQAALEASKHQPLMEVTCNLRNRQLPQQAQHSGAKASKFAAAPRHSAQDG
ncbi:Uncharacterized protein R408 [Durusdinium trenchii]|uniref:Uncharacterized protein R408 n=1 Tax=Durusdinium trenchii TaxID=1381693 RepID=A0ABP0NBX8_9DINO